ncbi:transcription activator GAGA-like [Hetaerina americana]|uniref:transcription activator GAGA-like n=1 Tax=Hetaerina americana TaxID=62018 RepID=UPI003A7F1DD6
MGSSQLYSLAWGEFGTSLVSTVQLLRCHGDLVDVTLAAGGRSFPAHKIVLSAASPFLLDLIKSTPCKHPVLLLAGVAAHDLEALLEFVYRGEVSVDPNQLPSLLQAAHYLNIQGLAPAAVASEKLDELSMGSAVHQNLTRNVINSFLPVRRRKRNRHKLLHNLEKGRTLDAMEQLEILHRKDAYRLHHNRKSRLLFYLLTMGSVVLTVRFFLMVDVCLLGHLTMYETLGAIDLILLVLLPCYCIAQYLNVKSDAWRPKPSDTIPGVLKVLHLWAIASPGMETGGLCGGQEGGGPGSGGDTGGKWARAERDEGIVGGSDGGGEDPDDVKGGESQQRGAASDGEAPTASNGEDFSGKKSGVSDQPAICPLCGATIRQSRNLRRHLELLHFGASSTRGGSLRVKSRSFSHQPLRPGEQGREGSSSPISLVSPHHPTISMVVPANPLMVVSSGAERSGLGDPSPGPLGPQHLPHPLTIPAPTDLMLRRAPEQPDPSAAIYSDPRANRGGSPLASTSHSAIGGGIV